MSKLMNRRDYGDSLLILATLVALSRKPSTSVGGGNSQPTNAVITGKMFGYGTYFATKARKSLGYTSLSGSYWAGGRSNSAFMSLYEVAYGIPYDAYSFESQYSSLNYERLQRLKPGSHCLHAHEGKMLRNDEIIVYKEDQTTIRYLVELSN